MVQKEKIGIITTISNWSLYEKTSPLFPPGIKVFAIDGTTGVYGLKSITLFLRKIKKYNIDWLIMADEDVIFIYPQKIFSLIEYLDKNDFTVCGMRDGGTLKWRNKNPYLINHFFAVLNLKEIYSFYNEREMLKQQFLIPNEFNDNLDGLRYKNYDTNSLYEPYYCFYLWLLRNGKRIKYLDAINPVDNDPETTLIYDHDQLPLLYHTWYARLYKKDAYHTTRIDNVLNTVLKENDSPYKNPIFLKSSYYNIKYPFYKLYRKIVRRLK